MQLDVLAIAAHPDDAEIALGGTLLKLSAAGRKIGIVDFTQGELGTRGSREERARETQRANELLGLHLRVNLGLLDGGVVASPDARERLAALIRETRPAVVIAHHTQDLHPDHAATGELARAAWYLAGLSKLAQRSGGASAHRPARIYHFMGHVHFQPTLVVDISAFWERKVELIRCYASQLAPADERDQGQHLLFGSDILSRAETKARYFGERIGARHGEPLLHIGPLPCFDPLLV